MARTEPNIQRVTFDEIEEFKDLNTEEILIEDNKKYSIMFNPSTGKFEYVEIHGGLNVTEIDAKTTSDITTVNPELGIVPGMVLKANATLDDLAKFILNPAVAGSFSISANKSVIHARASADIIITHNFTQNDEGAILSINYYLDGVLVITSTTPTETITVPYTGVEKTFEIKAVAVTDISGDLVSTSFTSKVYVRNILPEFYGFAGAASRPILPADFINTYYSTSQDAIFDLPALSSGVGFYWFAVLHSKTPTSWVTVDASGVEDAINNGGIPGLFIANGQVTFDSDVYNVYITDSATDFADRVKIKIT